MAYGKSMENVHFTITLSLFCLFARDYTILRRLDAFIYDLSTMG